MFGCGYCGKRSFETVEAVLDHIHQVHSDRVDDDEDESRHAGGCPFTGKPADASNGCSLNTDVD